MLTLETFDYHAMMILTGTTTESTIGTLQGTGGHISNKRKAPPIVLHAPMMANLTHDSKPMAGSHITPKEHKKGKWSLDEERILKV